MSEERKYIFACRKSFADFISCFRSKSTKEPSILTLREFVDIKLFDCLKEPAFFQKVKIKEFFEDCRDNYLEPKYLKMLGWQYPEACRLIERDTAIFIMTIHPRFESRLYDFGRARDDDEYCYKIICDCYTLRGGLVVREEYDPIKHTPDYQYPDPRRVKQSSSIEDV